MPRASDPPGVDEPRVAPGLVAPEGTPLYVHLPFCETKCPYCDFLSLAIAGQDVEGTVEGILREAAARAPRAPRTVFLGGGTPSILPPDLLKRFLDGLDEITGFRASAAEATCECNPESLDRAKAELLLELGIDRISIGFQSLRPKALELLGRVHSAEQSLRAFHGARAAGVERLSLDLIHSTPDQRADEWAEDLRRVIDLGPDHISAYGLTYEEGTPFHAWLRQGRLQEAPDEDQLSLLAITCETLEGAGYHPYEVSNYSLKGQECQHNVNYWLNGPYVGLGPSAVSHVGATRFGNPRSLGAWREAVDREQFPASWEETLEPADSLAETWWLGLRLRTGVDPALARATAGVPEPTDGTRDPAEHLAAELAAEGWLEWEDGRWRLTQRGLPLADAIAARFLQRLGADSHPDSRPGAGDAARHSTPGAGTRPGPE